MLNKNIIRRATSLFELGITQPRRITALARLWRIGGNKPMSLMKKLCVALVCICNPQAWHQYPLSSAGTASTAGRIAAVSRSSNTMEVFWIGPNGTVEDRYYYDGMTSFKGYTLAGPGSASTTSGIAAISRAFSTME